jgi:hypothetical protein
VARPDGGATVDQAIDALLDEYDVMPDQLRSDVVAFVLELAEAGLVDVRDA